MAEDWFASHAPSEDWFASQAPPPPSPKAALALEVASKAIPAARTALLEVATNPNVPKVGSVIGQVVGGVQGAIRSPLDAAGGAWAGGKAGWFTGKLAQKLATPLAAAAEKVAPYAQTLSTLAGAQGVNDLAQMAEPNRKDIGFLGLAGSMNDLEELTKAIAKGANPAQAAAQIAGGNPQRFGALMTAYMQSRQVK